jgi:hypothetical protein
MRWVLAGLVALIVGLGAVPVEAQSISGGGITTLYDGTNTFPALPTLQFSGGTLSKPSANTISGRWRPQLRSRRYCRLWWGSAALLR